MDDVKSPHQEMPDSTPSKAKSRKNSWIIGLTLLLGGGILLIRNLVGWQSENWWILFLIIPAIGAFATAWSRYRSIWENPTECRFPTGGFGFPFLDCGRGHVL